MRHVLPPHAALCDMYMCCRPMAPGATPRARVRATLVSVGFSLANTSFTSALGFLSLAFSPVPALGSFGAPTRLSTWHLGLQPPPPRPTASPQRLAAATACAPRLRPAPCTQASSPPSSSSPTSSSRSPSGPAACCSPSSRAARAPPTAARRFAALRTATATHLPAVKATRLPAVKATRLPAAAPHSPKPKARGAWTLRETRPRRSEIRGASAALRATRPTCCPTCSAAGQRPLSRAATLRAAPLQRRAVPTPGVWCGRWAPHPATASSPSAFCCSAHRCAPLPSPPPSPRKPTPLRTRVQPRLQPPCAQGPNPVRPGCNPVRPGCSHTCPGCSLVFVQDCQSRRRERDVPSADPRPRARERRAQALRRDAVARRRGGLWPPLARQARRRPPPLAARCIA